VVKHFVDPKEHSNGRGLNHPKAMRRWCGRNFSQLYTRGTADQVVILFALETLEDPRHRILDGGIDNPHGIGMRFHVAFAILLWPLITYPGEQTLVISYYAMHSVTYH